MQTFSSQTVVVFQLLIQIKSADDEFNVVRLEMIFLVVAK